MFGESEREELSLAEDKGWRVIMEVRVQIKQRAFEEAVARANLTYIEVAKMLGINRIYLSNLKNEKFPEFRPSGKLRENILKLFNDRNVETEFDDIFKITKNGRNGK